MGTQYWVNNVTGNDGGTGAEGDKWKSIGKFMQTNAGDDHCAVQYTGVNYTEEDGVTDAIGQIITAGAFNAPTVIEGYTSVLGDGTRGLIVLDAGDEALANCINSALGNVALYHTFRYFRFTGGSSHGVDLIAEDSVVWFGCRFDNNGADGIVGDNDHRFVLSQFDNNSNDGCDCDNQTLAFNCIAYANVLFGFSLTANSTLYTSISYENGGGQTGIWSKASNVLNCIVDGNNSTDIGVANAKELSIIANTIIYDCSTGIDGQAGSEDLCISLNNLFHSNTADVNNWPTDPSDIFDDPLFVDAANNDYRVQTGSPARQAGIDAGELTNSISFMDVGAHQARDSNLIATSGADFEAVLRAYLVAQTTLTDETSTRIYVDEFPEGFTIDKALLLRESSGSDQETVPATEAFVEFLCAGATLKEAKEVYIALHAVLRATNNVTMTGKKVWWNEKTFGPVRLDDPDTDWPTVQCEYRFRVAE